MSALSLSPSKRAWLRFKKNKLGLWSLIVFSTLVVLSLFADVLSSDKPLIVSYQGSIYFPIAKDYSEKTFGGDFDTPADYLDPFIKDKLTSAGNWAVYPLTLMALKPSTTLPSRPIRLRPQATTGWAQTTGGVTCWRS